MERERQTLIEEVKSQISSLEALQKTNPSIIDYLPMDLQIAIDSALDLVEGGLATESIIKKKGFCDRMKAKWQKLIITPFTIEAQALARANTPNLFIVLNQLAEQYYSKFKKKKWFDPQHKMPIDHYIEAINVTRSERTILLKRLMQTDDDGQLSIVDGQPIEVPSEITGVIVKDEIEGLYVGKDDLVEIAVPSSSLTELVLGGELEYDLDSLTEPDTFVITDGKGNEVCKEKNSIGVKNGKRSFDAVSGNLIVDVIESTDTSQWELSIVFNFISVEFKLPKCDESAPCPKW